MSFQCTALFFFFLSLALTFFQCFLLYWEGSLLMLCFSFAVNVLDWKNVLVTAIKCVQDRQHKWHVSLFWGLLSLKINKLIILQLASLIYVNSFLASSATQCNMLLLTWHQFLFYCILKAACMSFLPASPDSLIYRQDTILGFSKFFHRNLSDGGKW